MKRYIILSIFSLAIFLGNFELSLSSSFPQRIISLGPYITEELYLLGAEDKLIGCTVYCKRPPDAEKKEKIGTLT